MTRQLVNDMYGSSLRVLVTLKSLRIVAIRVRLIEVHIHNGIAISQSIKE
ncbi:MAG: hypothetical protein M5F18_08570 [Asgard group archaeon]|nr:hypothetical protein [Asgard group archaeon]